VNSLQCEWLEKPQFSFDQHLKSTKHFWEIQKALNRLNFDQSLHLWGFRGINLFGLRPNSGESDWFVVKFALRCRVCPRSTASILTFHFKLSINKPQDGQEILRSWGCDGKEKPLMPESFSDQSSQQIPTSRYKPSDLSKPNIICRWRQTRGLGIRCSFPLSPVQSCGKAKQLCYFDWNVSATRSRLECATNEENASFYNLNDSNIHKHENSRRTHQDAP
jgi:hypothetical protein